MAEKYWRNEATPGIGCGETERAPQAVNNCSATTTRKTTRTRLFISDIAFLIGKVNHMDLRASGALKPEIFSGV